MPDHLPRPGVLLLAALALATAAALPVAAAHDDGSTDAPAARAAGSAAGSTTPRARVAASSTPSTTPSTRPSTAASVRAPAPPVVAYRLPVAGPVARFFDPPPVRWAAGHRGVDLLAEAGATVLAPGPGTVVFSGVVVDRAVLTIRHPDGLRSSLEPLSEPVAQGAVVAAGDAVGRVAAPPAHCAPAACLHWGVRGGDAYVDPLGLLAPAPVLLPGAG